MPTTTCFCGATLEGPDRDAQVAAAKAHFDGAHGQMGLTAVQLRNFLEREGELTGPIDRLDRLGQVEVVPLTADRVDDVLRFFDHDAFPDNPGWAACYCMAHHVREGEWSTRTWQQNRDDLAARIGDGRTTGVLCYVDGRLAAWCNASPRREYPEHCDGTEADRSTGYVACFVVAPPYRGHGIAKQLLDAALDVLRAQGLTAVEAGPPAEVTRQEQAYRGTVRLYEQAGFTPAGPARTYVTVRRSL